MPKVQFFIIFNAFYYAVHIEKATNNFKVSQQCVGTINYCFGHFESFILQMSTYPGDTKIVCSPSLFFCHTINYLAHKQLARSVDGDGGIGRKKVRRTISVEQRGRACALVSTPCSKFLRRSRVFSRECSEVLKFSLQ